jgi:hypothetical protein
MPYSLTQWINKMLSTHTDTKQNNRSWDGVEISRDGVRWQTAGIIKQLEESEGKGMKKIGYIVLVDETGVQWKYDECHQATGGAPQFIRSIVVGD